VCNTTERVLAFARMMFRECIGYALDDPSGLDAADIAEYRLLAADLNLDYEALVAEGTSYQRARLNAIEHDKPIPTLSEFFAKPQQPRAKPMRNLADYPITKAEIIGCLKRISDEIIKDEAVGDMTPLLLEIAAKIVERSGPDIIPLDFSMTWGLLISENRIGKTSPEACYLSPKRENVNRR
jgi:hypothetical protein